jgi:hypothetical protein
MSLPTKRQWGDSSRAILVLGILNAGYIKDTGHSASAAPDFLLTPESTQITRGRFGIYISMVHCS